MQLSAYGWMKDFSSHYALIPTNQYIRLKANCP